MKPSENLPQTAQEIDNLKVSKEKELREAQNALHTIELEELQIAKEIVALQSERKDLQIALSKAKHVVKTLRLDIAILVSEFWRAKEC